MRDVTLHIGGRHYRLACAAGEEERLGQLGAMIDRQLANEPGLVNQSEPRMLLYAALLLADQLDELEKQRTAPVPVPAAAGPEAEILERLADRLETIAGELEEAVGNA